MKNWKTTVAGIGTILTAIGGAIALAVNDKWTEAVSALITGITAGIGLIAAKDHNVTGGNVQQ